MPPKFSLEPVLEVRRTRREALEVALAQLMDARRRAEEKRLLLQTRHARLLAELRRRQEGQMDLALIRHLRAMLQAMERQMASLENEIRRLDRQVEAKRQELVAAKQDEETLETLKEKAWAAFRAELARQEARVLDDVYIAQAYRRA